MIEYISDYHSKRSLVKLSEVYTQSIQDNLNTIEFLKSVLENPEKLIDLAPNLAVWFDEPETIPNIIKHLKADVEEMQSEQKWLGKQINDRHFAIDSEGDLIRLACSYQILSEC